MGATKQASETTLAEALAAAQCGFAEIKKDKTNSFFNDAKYASLDSVIKATTPSLKEHGLTVTQPIEMIDGSPIIRTRLIHKGGECIESVLPLIVDRQNMQGLGSAITYARRYSLCAILNVAADEDDDGNVAAQAEPQPEENPFRQQNQNRQPPAEKKWTVRDHIAATSSAVALNELLQKWKQAKPVGQNADQWAEILNIAAEHSKQWGLDHEAWPLMTQIESEIETLKQADESFSGSTDKEQ